MRASRSPHEGCADGRHNAIDWSVRTQPRGYRYRRGRRDPGRASTVDASSARKRDTQRTDAAASRPRQRKGKNRQSRCTSGRCVPSSPQRQVRTSGGSDISKGAAGPLEGDPLAVSRGLDVVVARSPSVRHALGVIQSRRTRAHLASPALLVLAVRERPHDHLAGVVQTLRPRWTLRLFRFAQLEGDFAVTSRPRAAKPRKHGVDASEFVISEPIPDTIGRRGANTTGIMNVLVALADMPRPVDEDVREFMH